jgi:hypothetical protein
MGVAKIDRPFVIDWVDEPTLNTLSIWLLPDEYVPGTSLLTKNDLPVRYSPAMVITATGLLNEHKYCLAYVVS